METGHIERLVQQLMGVPQWRRLRLMIQGCPHDADREVMVKFIRSLLMANLTEFRRSKPL